MWWVWVAYFAGGWVCGVVLEWLLHVIMHKHSLAFHIHHHHDFFQLPAREVAIKDLSPRLNVLFLLGVLLVLSPGMYWLGVKPVLLIWGGIVWHLLIVYEACHALIHYDAVLPEVLKCRGAYQWWRACHIEHHRHSPAGNFCVSFPVLDVLFGTYVRPKS